MRVMITGTGVGGLTAALALHEAGIEAEQTLQLPPRDTVVSEKAAATLADDIATGRELRHRAHPEQASSPVRRTGTAPGAPRGSSESDRPGPSAASPRERKPPASPDASTPSTSIASTGR